MIWRLALTAFLTLCLVAIGQAPRAQFNGCAAGFCTPATVSSGGCSQATTFLARTSGLNVTHQNAYTTMICGMVTDGTWAHLDALYVFATSTTTIAQLNLVSTSFTGTTVGTMTFTADSDYQPNAINSYIDTHDNTSTSGGLYAQNSAHLSVWVKNQGANNEPTAGDTGAINSQLIYTSFGGSAYCRINNTTAGGVSNGGNGGLFFGNRSGATAWQCYQNASSINTGADASVALINVDQSFPGNNGVTPGSNIMAASIGDSMTSTQEGNFYAKLHGFLQTIAGIP